MSGTYNAAEAIRERRLRVVVAERAEQATLALVPTATTAERSGNVLRPQTFDQIVGQDPAKMLMRAAVRRAQATGEPLAHVLLVGPAGTGKTTFSHVVAHEMGVQCFSVAAPISFDVLSQLREQMQDGDVLLIDEIHQQAITERRGREASSSPEQLYAVMEDHVLMTSTGVLPFPRITIIGATTDPGRLPQPFLERFPLRPRLRPYSVGELGVIARANAASLGLQLEPQAAELIAGASRRTPRLVNNLVKNAALFTDIGHVSASTVRTVLEVNGLTEDGLDSSMQDMLLFLERSPRTVRGETRYQASVGSIATAIGLSRDVKAVQLYVEPWLIFKGFVQVLHNGRVLTDAGLVRARELL